MRKLLLFTITFFIALGVNAAFGYSFTEDFEKGFYWKSFPVNFDIQESDSSEEDRLEGYLTVVIKDWEDETGYDIWTQVYSGTQNVIRWTSDITGETGYPSATTLGVTVRYNVGTFFERVEILLNKSLPDLVSNKNNILHQTILHEMGHTVGLGHSDQSGIMYPTLGRYNQLYTDDIEGMKAVIEESFWRQDVGYVSDDAYTTVQSPNCGNTSAASNGAALGYIVSLIFGILGTYLPISVIARKLFPIQK